MGGGDLIMFCVSVGWTVSFFFYYYLHYYFVLCTTEFHYNIANFDTTCMVPELLWFCLAMCTDLNGAQHILKGQVVQLHWQILSELLQLFMYSVGKGSAYFTRQTWGSQRTAGVTCVCPFLLWDPGIAQKWSGLIWFASEQLNNLSHFMSSIFYFPIVN